MGNTKGMTEMYNHDYLTAVKLFNEKYEKLRRCSFYRRVFGQKTGVTISKKVDKPLKVKRRGPSEEAIDAFVLTFRFFIQDNDKSSFRNIAKIYDSLPISRQKKSLFKLIRKRLNEFLDSESMLKLNKKPLIYRYVLDIFMYGGLSHANIKKKEKYDQWMSYPGFNQLIMNEFVFILGNVMNFITYIRNLNDEVIKELRGK
jgi:hypothetical protein